ncbi:MAG TPA: Ig-like domain-containing protein [Gemmatimonadaceae bacterium]|nr:Ig-like domain-containing protein [Gemmatimonadaceae bacterium]
MRRRLAALAALAALATIRCASPGLPPGGPEDKVPPKLVSTMPDTNAVNVRPKGSAEFKFDEVISERPAGANDLAGLVLISPDDGAPRVSWHRTSIRVRPHRDWRANTVYTITLLPGITDLRGNIRRERTELIFATGRTIPQTRLDGVVYDWVQGRAIPAARVEAVAPDSTRYVGVADSTGRYVMRYLPPARYVVRAYQDQNNNRTLDPREIWDSTVVSLADTSAIDFYAFAHDSAGARIANVEVRDSVTLRVTFDRAIDPRQTIDSSLFSLAAADSTRLRIVSAEAAARDTVTSDTTARRDTTARDTLARTVVPPLVPRRDTTRAAAPPPAPPPSRPSPPMAVTIRLAQPLAAGASYRLTAREVRGLLGVAATTVRTFTVPSAPGPATLAPADTSRERRPAQPPAPAVRPPGFPTRPQPDTARPPERPPRPPR